MINIITPEMFKRDFYIATRNYDVKKYDEYGRAIGGFNKPVGFIGKDGINYQPLTDETDIRMYGDSANAVVKAVIMNTDKAFETFSKEGVEGSVVYLFGSSPDKKPYWFRGEEETESTHGEWANYTVDAVMPMLFHVNVFFKKVKRTGTV